MKVLAIHQALNRKLRLWILPASLSLGLFSANVSQAGLSNTLTWIGGTNTNAAISNNYSVSPAFGGANVFNMSNTIYTYVYTNTNNYQSNGPAVFSYSSSNIGAFGYQFMGYSNVVVTNLGGMRLDSAGLIASNSSGTGTVYIYNNANSNNQITGNTIFTGNMVLFMGAFANHSSTARILTNNLNSLAFSNLNVNSMSATTVLSANNVSLTWAGTGTATILGPITVTARSNTNNTHPNAGAMIVSSGILNIASTNSANTNASTGWNSGLLITNSGSVFVQGQDSLGAQDWNIKIATTTGGTTTFGVFDRNEWATNNDATCTLTNNIDIFNATNSSATNIFQSGTAANPKTFILSGGIASPTSSTNIVYGNYKVTNAGTTNTYYTTNYTTNTYQPPAGTLLFQYGTTVLSGSNTNLSLPILVTNGGTLVASNAKALGSGSVTVATNSTLRVHGAVTNAVTNAGTVLITNGGSLVSGNLGTGALNLSATAPAPDSASFASSRTLGTNSVGSLTLAGNSTLILNPGTKIKSSGAVAISSDGNFITVTNSSVSTNVGTNNLVEGTGVTVATGSSIILNGSAVDNGTIPLGSTYTNTNNQYRYTFTNSPTALQLIVQKPAGEQGPQDLAFAKDSGAWSTNVANSDWVTTNGATTYFTAGDSALFTNNASVAVASEGVNPNLVTFSNSIGTTVSLGGGDITANNVNVSGAGEVVLSNNLIVSQTEIVSGGMLTVNGTNAVGGLTLSNNATMNGSGVVTNSTAYDMQSGTANVVLQGANGLNKTTAGTVTLGATNTYTGTTTISAGTLSYGTNDAIASGAVTVSGGTLDIGSYSDTVGAVTASGGNITGTNGGVLTGASYALTNGTGSTNTISAILGGSGSLTKSGAGTYILSTNNTYTGATTINTGGVLAFGVSNAISTNSAVAVAGTLDLGGYTGTFGGINGTVTNNIMLSGGTITNGALSLNNDLVVTNGGTISASVSGSGGINNGASGGSGTLLISASNNYTGVTEQRGSTLKIGNNYALGATNGDTWVYGGGGGGLDLNGFTITDETMNLTNSSAFVTNSSASAATWAGNVKLAASGSRGFSVGTGDISVSGSISGSASRFLNKYGTGTLTLSGSNAVQGFISVNEGTLKVANAGALGLNSSLNGVGVSNGATLDLNGYTNSAASRFINIAGTGVGGKGALYNGSANSAVLSNAVAMTNNTTIGNVGNLTLSGSLIGGSYAFVTNVPSAGVTNTNFTTNIIAGVSLTKVGAGTLYLTATNSSYSGGTIVNNGAVAISNGKSLGINSTGGIGSITLAGSAGNTATLMSTKAEGTDAASMATLTLGDVTMNGNSILSLSYAYSQFSVTSLVLGELGNQIDIGSTVWNIGTYDLLSSSLDVNTPNSLSLLVGTTTITNGQTSNNIIGRKIYNFSYVTNTAANNYSYKVNISANVQNLNWNGSENNAWNTTATNWNQAGSSSNIAFTTEDNVTFKELGGNTNIVVDSNGVTAGTMTVTNTGGALTVSGGNVTADLKVADGGNLIVEGTVTPTGSLSIDRGTLQIGSGGTNGALGNANAINITNGGSLIVNLSTNYYLSNRITGDGSFRNVGSGTTLMTTNNTYSGQTLVEAGTLQIGSSAAGSNATPGSGEIKVSNGATLAFKRSNVYTNGNNISGQGSVSQLGTQGLELSGSNTFSGGLYLNTNANGAVWATNGTNLGSGTIYAVSSNSKIGLSKLGVVSAPNASMTITNQLNTSLAGTTTDVLTFQPGQSNTYSITLDGQITGSGVLKIGSSATNNGSGVLGTGTGNLYVNNTNNNYTGGTELGNGRIIIGNGSALGTGAILFSSTNLGNTILQITNNTTLSQNFTLGASAANSTAMAVIDTANSVVLNGVLSNRTSTQIGSLIKTGSGTLTLNATNTYTGGTAVNAGTLVVGSDSRLSTSSAVTVSNLATLKFNQDSTVGPLTVAGTLEQGLVKITSVTDVVFSGGAILKVNGTPTLDSYTLVEGSSVTGIPTYDGATGYELRVDSTSVKLVKSGSTFGSIYPSGSEETVGSNGLQNLMSYALGGTGPSSSPALPVLSIDTNVLTGEANGLTLTANIRNDDSSLTVVGQWAYNLEGPWTDVQLTPTDSTSAVPNTTTKSFTQLVDPSQPRKFLRIQVSK